MIGGAITLDTCEVAARLIRMHYAEINPKFRYSDLGMYCPSMLAESGSDCSLKVGVIRFGSPQEMPPK
jgi:hypothetical protein